MVSMKLVFLGTRGYIEAKTRRHRRHTSLLVAYRGREVMIDCGLDWLGEVSRLPRRPVVVTHAHPDHVEGLQQGAPGPVYAPPDVWQAIDDYPIAERNEIKPRTPVAVRGITFEAFRVEHSLRCPAVGYRVTAGRVTIFYVPDVVYIHEREEALAGAQLYIGDGATLKRSFVRKRGKRLIGHTPVQTQLTWCQKEGIRRAIITHCGTQIVAGDERKIGAQLRAMAAERGVEAEIAHDGLKLVLR